MKAIAWCDRQSGSLTDRALVCNAVTGRSAWNVASLSAIPPTLHTETHTDDDAVRLISAMQKPQTPSHMPTVMWEQRVSCCLAGCGPAGSLH